MRFYASYKLLAQSCYQGKLKFNAGKIAQGLRYNGNVLFCCRPGLIANSIITTIEFQHCIYANISKCTYAKQVNHSVEVVPGKSTQQFTSPRLFVSPRFGICASLSSRELPSRVKYAHPREVFSDLLSECQMLRMNDTSRFFHWRSWYSPPLKGDRSFEGPRICGLNANSFAFIMFTFLVASCAS